MLLLLDYNIACTRWEFKEALDESGVTCCLHYFKALIVLATMKVTKIGRETSHMGTKRARLKVSLQSFYDIVAACVTN
jgi:hypothetical protein